MKVNTTKSQITDKTVDLSNASFATTQVSQHSPFVGGTSALAVVNTKKNGLRLSFLSKLIDSLGDDVKTVQIAWTSDNIIVGRMLSDTASNYLLKHDSRGKRAIIYNASLVKEITKYFELDFSGRSTVSFPTYTISEIADGSVVALIPVR